MLYLLCLIIFVCASALAQDAESIEAQFRAAENAFRQRAWEEALMLYEALANSFPQHPQAHVGVAESAMRIADYPKAIAAYQRARQLLPDLPKIQAGLANAFLRNAQLDEADALYQQAVKGAGNAAPVRWYNDLGFIETQRGNYEQARRYYIVAAQLHPDATDTYDNLGAVLLKLNRLDEADAAFYTALELDEADVTAIFGRGQVEAARRNLDKARRFYQQAIKLDPGAPAVHYALAQAFFRLGLRGEAQASLARYRQTKAQRYMREAQPLLKGKQWPEALAKLQKAVEVEPAASDAAQQLAYGQMRLGDLEAAKREYHRVNMSSQSGQALLVPQIIPFPPGNGPFLSF